MRATTLRRTERLWTEAWSASRGALWVLMTCLVLVSAESSALSFGSAVTYSEPSILSNSTYIAPGDLNGDGVPDIVQAYRLPGGNNLSIRLGSGSGTGLYLPATKLSAGTYPDSVAVGDFDGDGRLDLALQINYGVAVLLGKGDGTFEAAKVFNNGRNGSGGIAVGDFNRDGELDFVLDGVGDSVVTILLGYGKGTFSTPVRYGAGNGPFGVAVGDLNGDGMPDLVVSNWNDPAVTVLLGNGDGTFKDAISYSTNNSVDAKYAKPNSIALGDVNGDNRLDVLVAHWSASSSDRLSILLGNGDGTLRDPIYGGGVGTSLVRRDFNGDGLADIATLDSDSGLFAVRLGNGDGTFRPTDNFAAGPGPLQQLIAADVNNDGRPDVVIAGFYGEVSVILNTTPVAAPAWTTPQPRTALKLSTLGTTPAPRAVVITHGYRSTAADWVGQLGLSYCYRLTGELRFAANAEADTLKQLCHSPDWDVWILDWRTLADPSCPLSSLPCPERAWRSAVNIGSDGLALHMKYYGYKHVHFLAHSAGSNLMQGATRALKDGGSTATIHQTFFDAYDPSADDSNPYVTASGGPYAGRHFSYTYGVNADWAENYVDTRDLIETEFGYDHTDLHLIHGFNIDVTPKSDACTSWDCRHSRPYRFYEKSLSGIDVLPGDPDAVGPTAGMGYPLSLEGGRDLVGLTRQLPPDGECRVEGSNCAPVPSPSDITQIWLPADETVSMDSSSGQATCLTADCLGLSLGRSVSPLAEQAPLKALRQSKGAATKAAMAATDTPSWLALRVRTNSAVNTLSFHWRFAPGGEGLLQVFVNEKWIRSFDQRFLTAASPRPEQLFIGNLPSGTHRVAFRLDGYGATPSGVMVSDIVLGQIQLSTTALGSTEVIEYYHNAFDHYFITGNADEIAKLDNGTFVGWSRTGYRFKAFALGAAAGSALCRFFSTSFAPKSSHFYTPFADECGIVKTNPDWQFEGEVFSIPVPTSDGACPVGTAPVYRLYNNGQGAAPNHRYTANFDVRSQMIAQGWVAEGYGATGVIMCTPN